MSSTENSLPKDFNQFTPDTISSILKDLKVDGSSSTLSPLTTLGQGKLDYVVLDNSMGGALSAQATQGYNRHGDDFLYGTGTTYLLGLAFGGSWGLMEALRSPHAQKTFKLRVNSVLNSVTRRGPFVANSLGIVALMYHGINYTIVKTVGRQDTFTNIASATTAGLIFKSTAGFRAAGIAGLVCGSFGALWNLTIVPRGGLWEILDRHSI